MKIDVHQGPLAEFDCAYLLLSGEIGLQFLTEHRIKPLTLKTEDGSDRPMPFGATYTAFKAVDFMWTNHPDVIPRDQLKQSMYIFWENPRTADLAIAALTKWQDWSVQDRMMQMYEQKGFEIPAVKRAIVKYFMECSMSGSEQTGEQAAYVATATNHLKTLEENDPEIVNQVREQFQRR